MLSVLQALCLELQPDQPFPPRGGACRSPARLRRARFSSSAWITKTTAQPMTAHAC